ncbi:hypothetical protein [Nostoc sp.]
MQKVGGFTSTNGAEISAFDSGSDRPLGNLRAIVCFTQKRLDAESKSLK